ncbi:hypothetical protein [Actinomyces sp. ZJ308]|uniref:hypothetical protein n=1 Tax=Actinomyces sp. ZJ308 TaxID=2708342 RepID=UPI001421568D|nr:hypothetical protein [Actinomyces sp. ZJ308]
MAQLIERLERDGTLITPSSKTRLTLLITLFLAFFLISLAMIITSASESSNPEEGVTLAICGIVCTGFFGLTTLVAYRQLSQGIRLVLTFQELRIENKDGGIIERTEWPDIEKIESRTLSSGGIYHPEVLAYHLTSFGKEQHDEFLHSNPIARQRYMIFPSRKRWTIAIPQRLSVPHKELFTLLTETHRRYRRRKRRYLSKRKNKRGHA